MREATVQQDANEIRDDVRADLISRATKLDLSILYAAIASILAFAASIMIFALVRLPMNWGAS